MHGMQIEQGMRKIQNIKQCKDAKNAENAKNTKMLKIRISKKRIACKECRNGIDWKECKKGKDFKKCEYFKNGKECQEKGIQKCKTKEKQQVKKRMQRKKGKYEIHRWQKNQE